MNGKTGMKMRHFLAASGLFVAMLATSLAQAALPIQHWTASSGARVYFVPSPSIPMLDINIDFDAGTRLDSAKRIGLASMAAGLLDKGVAAHASKPARTEGELADAFADLGAEFASGASDDRASVRLRTLSSPEERQAAIALMAQIISRPAYPGEIVEREKSRMTAALRETFTRPGAIAGRSFNSAVFGDHPYGYTASPETVQAVTRDDLVAFHRQRYGAAQAVVTLIGAIDRGQAQEIAEQLTADLPRSSAAHAKPALLPVQPLSAPRTIRVPHPAQQAHVLVGQPGIARNDPDFFAILVGNHILGGGSFTSRLTVQVREQRGLTYGIGSGFSPLQQAGPFQISVQTRQDQVDEALQVIRTELGRFVAEGPTEAEMTAAKANLIQGFPLRLDSNRKLIANVANIAWYGLPLDYLDTWTKEVENVTADRVRAAFQRVLHPDRMVTVVVGGASPKGQ
jgi:zinc protease